MIKWRLEALYNGFDAVYESELNQLRKLIKEYDDFAANELSGDPIEVMLKYIEMNEKIRSLSSNLYAYPLLVNSTNTKDEVSEKYLDIMDQLFSQLTKPNVSFMKWISNINNLDTIALTNQKIKENLFHLSQLKIKSNYLLSDAEEILLSKMQLTGGESWSKLQGKLTSNLMVEITTNDETKLIPLSEARNLAYHDDGFIRKHAYQQELKAYSTIEDAIAMSISNIKRETNYINEFRGYQSPLEMTLMDSRLREETLHAMIKAMKKYLPEFRRYLKKKAEFLGHENGLPFYDLFAPVGTSKKVYSYDEAKKIILKNFLSFSPTLSNFAEKSFAENWIDVEPRESKIGGAFCYNLPVINESRILTNFTGSLSNISTLAHELGHGYHGQIIAENSPLNWDYPMPLAETASILCETIVMNSMLDSLEDNEALYVLETDLMGSTQVVVDILSRFFFETELFEKTKEVTLSSKQLQEMMLKAQKYAYGDALDQDYLHPYMWLNKPHYYSPNLHFYNFPYAFGLLYAKGLYAQFIIDKKTFIKKYDAMLKETGKNTIENVASMMGIDVTTEEFWIDSLEIIKTEIERFCMLVDASKKPKITL